MPKTRAQSQTITSGGKLRLEWRLPVSPSGLCELSFLQRMKTPFRETADDVAAKPSPSAQAIGSLLRRRREQLELDLDTVGDALCIKPAFLAALEEGRGQDLPGPTYAVGFIRAYSDYLGFDSDRVLERYKEAAETPARPDLALPAPLGERSLPGGRILLIGLIVALCGYGTWHYLATGDQVPPDQVAAVPAALEQQAAAIKAPAAEKPPAPDAPGPLSAAAEKPDAQPASTDAAPPSSSPGDISTPAPAEAAAPDPHIDIRALADCWVQVRGADQQIVFSRVLKAGETFHVPRPGLFLRTENAGALAIAVNGKPAPSLGDVGALRRNVALDPEALLAGKAARG